MDCITPRPQRQAALIAIHPDGLLEAFAERNLDVAFARIPAATSLFGEQTAEDCFELLLPKRYRDLWRRDYLRASSSTKPLTAEAVMAALAMKDCLATLEPYMPPKPQKNRGAA